MGSTFNGTPFNDEQLDHMRSIAALPDEKVSWCGWGRAGDPHCCCNPDCVGKREGKTLADKKKVWCPTCRLVPENGMPRHTKFCTASVQTGGDHG